MEPDRSAAPVTLRASRFIAATGEDLSALAGTHIFEAAQRDRLAKLGIADQSYVDWLRLLLPYMLETYSTGSSPRVLDFGCGTAIKAAGASISICRCWTPRWPGWPTRT